MKNLLWFLLGFFCTLSIGMHLANAENGYPGACQQWFFLPQNTVTATTCKSTIIGSITLTNSDTGMTYSTTTTTVCAGGTWTNVYLYGMFWSTELNRWAYSYTGVQVISVKDLSVLTAAGAIQVAGNNEASFKAARAGCLLDCGDSDSDGVCDQCDVAPNDSTMGKTGYAKGYYVYNGKTVAGLTSYSPTNDTYDAIEIYENDTSIPGYVLGLGMPTHIIESEFLEGGGKFVALQTPEAVYNMSCPPVTSSDQCGQIECNIEPVGSTATNELPNNGKGETEVAETDQKAEDAGMLDLDKTCDQLRSKCASSCGGATNIQSFACSENEHMVCQCLSNGEWELAKDWSEVGKQITITETTTTPVYGDGDTSSGGGGAVTVGGSSDGSLTGSYGYVEGTMNFDTLSSHFSQFNSKFPFSLRSTLNSIYSDFKGTGAAPVYTYSVYGKTVTIDLAAWNDIAKMIRSFFALGITLSTIVLLIYLYVGIDLRGK